MSTMDGYEKYPTIYQDLFIKTEELFGFIEEQKKLQLQIIGLMKGINDCPNENKTDNELTLAITNLTSELKKSVESQKSIQCNLNEVLQTITTCHSGVQVNTEITNLFQGDDNDDRTIPQITNISNSPSPNRLSPNKDITEVISIPDCISKSSTNSWKIKSKKDDCRKFSTLREDFKIISKPNMYIYVLDRFCERLSEEQEDWSEPFYTSHVGYRMAAKIGFCKDYLGIYVKLVEGDFDDLLAWPFRSEITFTLLNQVDEDRNITKILKPHPCDPDEYGYWTKPKCPNSCMGGWGFNNFIGLCIIKGPNDDFVSEYLRNDIIYIKIKLLE